MSAPSGICRYCGKPRPHGYAVTCGGSECQEADAREVMARAGRFSPDPVKCGLCARKVSHSLRVHRARVAVWEQS